MRHTLVPVLIAFALAGCSRGTAPEPEPEAAAESLSAKVSAATLEDYQGDWAGVLRIMGQELPLELHVTPGGEAPVTLDSPAQNAFGLAASDYGVEDGSLFAEWVGIGASYRGSLGERGKTVSGRFRQRGLELELVFDRVVGSNAAAEPRRVAEAARPQEPERPFPYRTQKLTVEGEPQLAGTLTLPTGKGPFPAVVMVTGSGPQDRDETVMGHKPFLLLADRLTRAGIATFRYDDRGVNESTGDFSSATIHDLAGDAGRAFEMVRRREEVAEVGFLGHSEGGLTAALSAPETRPAFIVALAAPFEPIADIIEGQVGEANRLAGIPEDVVSQNMVLQRRILDAARTGDSPEEACAAIAEATDSLTDPVQKEAQQLCTPGFYDALRLDVSEVYAAYDGPMLVLFGERDRQIPADANAKAADVILGGRENVRIEIVPEANHLFQRANTGAVSEYAQIEQTMMERVPEEVAEFVLVEMGADR